jgi:hypothetical protein
MTDNERIETIKKKFDYDGFIHKDIKWLIDQSEKIKSYEKTMLKIKEVYENGEQNEIDELLYGLFTNEIYNDSY